MKLFSYTCVSVLIGFVAVLAFADIVARLLVALSLSVVFLLFFFWFAKKEKYASWACVAVVCLTCAFSLTAFPWKVAFWYSQNTFESISAETGFEKGRIGLFYVKNVGSRNGDKYFQIHGHDQEINGIVKTQNLNKYNIWSKIHLSGDWYYIIED